MEDGGSNDPDHDHRDEYEDPKRPRDRAQEEAGQCEDGDHRQSEPERLLRGGPGNESGGVDGQRHDCCRVEGCCRECQQHQDNCSPDIPTSYFRNYKGGESDGNHSDSKNPILGIGVGGEDRSGEDEGEEDQGCPTRETGTPRVEAFRLRESDSSCRSHFRGTIRQRCCDRSHDRCSHEIGDVTPHRSAFDLR